MKTIFKYFEPLWLGSKGKLSIRRVLALCFSIDFIINTSHAIHTFDVGKSFSDVAMLLGIEAGLVAALLSLTTYSNSLKQKQDESI
jgi:hypothetical protein